MPIPIIGAIFKLNIFGAISGFSKLKKAANSAKGAAASAGGNLEFFSKAARGVEHVMHKARVKIDHLGKAYMGETKAQQKATVGMTHFQRNVHLTTKGITSATAVSRELRNWLNLIARRRRIKLQTMTAKLKMTSLKATIKSTKLQMQALNSTVAQGGQSFASFFGVALGGLGFLAIGKSMSEVAGNSFRLSMNLEAAKVSFNVMLGSAKKTEDLFKRISEYSAATPFQRMDLIEGARLLLRVTRDNVDENERLLKLAANIAAIKPGTKVADIAQGMAQATVGEFETLKTMGLVLTAEMFQNLGPKTGKAYVQGVLGEIEKQFTVMTGGRDLVKALSETTLGKISTLSDNIEFIMIELGDSISKALDFKGVLDDLIEGFSGLRIALEAIFKDEAIPKDVPPGLIAVAETIKDLTDRIEYAGKITVNMFRSIATGFNDLDATLQRSILGGALSSVLAAGGISAGMTAVGVAMTAVGAIVAGVAGVVGMIGAIPAAIASYLAIFGSLSVIGVAIIPAIAAVTSLVGAFMTIRRDGEGVGQTFMRVGRIIYRWGIDIFRTLMVVLEWMWSSLRKKLIPAWEEIQKPFRKLRPSLESIMEAFQGSMFSMEQWAEIGQKLGSALGTGILWAAKAFKWAMFGIIVIFEAFVPLIKDTINTIRVLGKAFIGLITGTGSAKSNLKIIMYGMLDIITLVFRAIATFVLTQVSVLIHAVATLVHKLPLGDLISKQIHGAADAVSDLKAIVDAGLTGRGKFEKKTSVDLALPDQTIKIESKTDINVDGDRLASTQANHTLNTRASGRGGDPLNPEEMGFVLDGTTVRNAELTEVAGRQ